MKAINKAIKIIITIILAIGLLIGFFYGILYLDATFKKMENGEYFFKESETHELFASKHGYYLPTNSVKQELLDSGINLTNSTNCDIALLTYDTELNYEKLCNFVKALNNGAKYIATHPDACCPSKEVFLPDAGSFIKMIEVSNGYLPEIIIGKPYTTMGEVLKNKFSNEVGKFIMVGDRLHTDIQFGINCGFHTLLVMSGETDENTKNTSLIKAEFVLNTLNDIKKYF